MSNMQIMTRSSHARGGYRVGPYFLVSGDLLEFVDGEHVMQGEVVYDGTRYLVLTADWRLIPLAEIVLARYLGHASLSP